MGEGMKCQHTPELVARHEAALATLTSTLNSFIQRNIDDRRDCALRYERDREESIGFRSEVIRRLETLESYIAGLRPDHKMLMILAMAIIVGSVTIVWRVVWGHVGRVIGGG